MHQVYEFLSFAVNLVATMVRSLFGTLVDLLPAPVWGAAVVIVVVLFLYSRLASRVEDLEMALLQIDAKLDTVLSRLARPRNHSERPDAGSGS